MQNLPVPASAMPLPANAAISAVPGATDMPSSSAPENDGFGAILAQHVIGIAAGLEPDAVLPRAATAEGQLQQPGGGIVPLQIPSEPGPAVLALVAPVPGIPPAERVCSDQCLTQDRTLPAALSTETSAQRNPPQAALPGGQVLESDNAADLAAPGKFLPPVAAGETSHSARAEPSAQRLPDPAPSPQMVNAPIVATAPPVRASAPSSHILKPETRVGAPGWDGELAQKVIWMATRQHQVAELQLDPPHLGPMEVMLTIGHDKGTQASVQFASPHLAVREAIEAALPRLRDMMAENGISLGNVTVSGDSFQQQAEAGRQDRLLMKQRADNPSTVSGFAVQPAASFIRIGRNGLVDTFA